jgi:tetratricopeptide (TPR) repeat protein
MQRIRQLIIEAHRRSIWQVLAVYVFGAWAVYQIIAEVTDRLGMPEWVPGFAIVLFLIGLPIVLATAFVQEGLPGQAPPAGPSDPTLVPGLQRADDPAERRESALLKPARPHFFLTWQRSVLAGITAFLLLGITASSYMGLRQAGVGPFASLLSDGTLTERDRIIVAQLTHTAGDSVTADALTEALRVDLAQSRVLTIVEQRFVGDALQRMGHSRNARLTAELARELAVREGAKAVLEGEMAPAGSGYIIAARLLHAGTGELLLSRRETAADDNDIIAAIDRLSKRLRADIGESLRDVRADRALEAVTTPSLTALQKYTQGVRALDLDRDYDRSIALLREAVAADSTFAMAWRKLGVAYGNSFAGNSQILPAATRAYEMRDRLTEREKYHTIAFYQLNVLNDARAAANAYHSLLELHPDDHAALNNLAVTYSRLREPARAVEYYRQAMAVDSNTASSWTNLAIAEFRMNNRAEARRLIDEIMRRFPEQRDGRAFLMNWLQTKGEYDEAIRIMREVRDSSRSSNAWMARSNFALAMLTQMRGRVGEARRHIADAAAANRSRGVLEADVWEQRYLADVDAWVLRRPEAAIARLDDITASSDWQALPATARGYVELAYAYASAGAPVRAQQLLDEWKRLPAVERAAGEDWMEPAVRGWIAMASNRPADAIAPFRESAQTGDCYICGLHDLGMAFEAVGAADSAIAYYRRYLDEPQLTRFLDDAWQLAPTYERLAELYAARGDTDNAAHYARLFTELWKDADPELQPRVRRMQQFLRSTIER